jgi:hypothetical protein
MPNGRNARYIMPTLRPLAALSPRPDAVFEHTEHPCASDAAGRQQNRQSANIIFFMVIYLIKITEGYSRAI